MKARKEISHSLAESVSAGAAQKPPKYRERQRSDIQHSTGVALGTPSGSDRVYRAPGFNTGSALGTPSGSDRVHPAEAGSGQTGGSLSAGELARAAGVSTDTLRHYERKGVLPIPPRSSNRYRTYPAAALDRVRLIRRALGIGFTLDELATILKERDRGGAPCHKVRDLAAEKLSDLEKQLSEMTALRDELQVILRDWHGRLSARAPGSRAALLESLPDLPLKGTRPSRQRLYAARTKVKQREK